MYISYTDILYYQIFDEVAVDILNTLSKLIKTRTFFISHLDCTTFSVLKVLNQNGINLTEGTRMSIEDAY